MIQELEFGAAQGMRFKLTGKLNGKDYRIFVPRVEERIRREGKIRLLLEFEDFRGWDLEAAWEDFKFGIKHFRDFDQIAIVGQGKREEWVAGAAKLFFGEKVRYFPLSEMPQAWEWLFPAPDGGEAQKSKPGGSHACPET